MACKNTCRLCNRLIISESVVYTAGTGLVIRIPAGSYNDNEKYCIVVGQAIPDTTVINAPVFIQIGEGSVLYPLTQPGCEPVSACGIKTRTRYATIVHGSLTVGVTDGNDDCVYLSDLLSGAFLKKVLCHELCHCFMMSYNISIPIEQEEFLADWISIYGEDLIYLLDDLMSAMSREVKYG